MTRSMGTLQINLNLQDLKGDAANKTAIAFDVTKGGEVTGKIDLSFGKPYGRQ